MRIALIVMVLCSCADRSGDGAPSAKPSGPAASAASAAPLVLEDRPVNLEWHDLKTSLTARVPAGWRESSPGSFRPAGDFPSPSDPTISYGFGNRSCDGECDDADIEANLAEMWARHVDDLKTPFYNTGDAKLDAVVLDVQVLEDTKLPDGRVVATKVTRPAGFTEHEQVERFTATCARHRKGDDFYVAVTVKAPLGEERGVWPLLLEACKKEWYR